MHVDTEEWLERRNVATAGITKALFLINGGGAVSLLAFLQGTWNQNSVLSAYIVISVAFMSLGLVLAAGINFLRFHIAYTYRSDVSSEKKWRNLYFRLSVGAFLSFICAVAVLLVGVFLAI